MKQYAPERVSRAVFFVVLGLSLLMFAAFYLVGYSRQSDQVLGFNEPTLTGALINFVLLLVVAVLAVVVWAVVSAVRQADKARWSANGIPAGTIVIAVVGLTLLVLLVSLLLSSSSPVLINGQAYTNKVWLKLSGMFVSTAVVMLLLATLAVGVSAWKGRDGRNRLTAKRMRKNQPSELS